MSDADAVVTVALPDGTYVGLRVTRGDGLREVASLPMDISAITSALKSVATCLGSAMSASGARNTSLEFGCDFSVETTGLLTVLAKGAAQATIKVTLEWSQDNAAS